MKFTLNQKQIDLSPLRLAYIVIIVFFVVYTGRDLNYNSAFVDEAIYATIGEEVLRGQYWERAIGWMGGSYLYPLMSAYVNRLYGLTGIRLMSMVLVLIAGITSGKIAGLLGGFKAEVLTILLFFSASISLNLAQLGTYDTPALSFLALSTYAAIHSRYHHGARSWALVALSTIFFTLAVYAKYFAAVFAPVVFLIIFFGPQSLKFKKSILWSLFFIITFGIFVVNNTDDLVSLYITSPFTEIKPRAYVFGKIWGDLTLHLPFAIAGAFYAAHTLKKEKRRLAIALFLAGAIPIAFHLGTGNARSLWKHMVITLMYWAPLTSYMLLLLGKNVNAKAAKRPVLTNSLQLVRTVIVVILVTNIWVNFSRHWRFQRSWPSATRIIEYLERNRNTGDKIFAEGATIYKYHLYDGFEDPFAWPSTWYLNYNGQEGVPAMQEAISNKEFRYIILNDFFTTETNKEILPTIQEHYNLVMTDTFKVSGVFDQTTRIWEAKP
jgi:hypothetical protein